MMPEQVFQKKRVFHIGCYFVDKVGFDCRFFRIKKIKCIIYSVLWRIVVNEALYSVTGKFPARNRLQYAGF